jgi:DNA-binding transcriptional MocR family regulator
MQRTIGASQVAELVAGFDASPAYRGLAESLRAVIADGRIPAGARLPSERQLMAALGVSRTTITRAYAQLRDHGFLASRQGSGWVTRLPQARGRRGDHLLPAGDQPHGEIDLTLAATAAGTGIMAAYQQALAQLPGYLAGAGYHPAGLPELREAVAASYAARGLPTDADQIMITPGALAGIAIAARALVSPGRAVLLESPTYPNAIATFARTGARVAGVDPADSWAGALATAAGQLRPAVAYLIPDFHNPTGALRSDTERRQAARALRQAGTTALIDESFALLNLDGQPMPAPFACFYADTISAGSLSKQLWAGLRIGWLRVPAGRMPRISRARLSLDLGTPVLEQLAATRLVGDTALAGQHRAQLRASRDAALAALAEQLPDWQVTRPGGGLFLWCTLPGPASSALVARAEQHGVVLAAGPEFAPEGGLDRYLRIPFAQPPDVLADAITRLARAWREILAGPPGPRRARPRRGATALVS